MDCILFAENRNEWLATPYALTQIFRPYLADGKAPVRLSPQRDVANAVAGRRAADRSRCSPDPSASARRRRGDTRELRPADLCCSERRSSTTLASPAIRLASSWLVAGSCLIGLPERVGVAEGAIKIWATTT